MGVRHLTESSSSGFSETIRPTPADDSSIEIKPLIDDTDPIVIHLKDFQDPAKFHIGMLTVSLLAGLAYGGYVTYNCWREKNVFLSHIRNLVIALTCRTFFSILFEGVIILESPLDVDGGNTLKSFESISLNLVVAFWLVLTIYIHARAQRNFNSEPTLKLYMYGVPGVAVYFALVEIFAMEGSNSSTVWWLVYYIFYFHQWVVNSLRLLYLLVQLALLVDIGRMMVVKSSDNDTVSLMRKVVLMMGILVLLFWLQFGLSVGRPPFGNPQPYLYFYYLIDGTQCVLVCLVLFFFNKWVPMILDKLGSIIMENGEMAGRLSRSNNEVLITGHDGKGIVTIDSLFVKEESEKRANAISEGREDVVYSSVVRPQNLQKTIDLYKRLNVIPTDRVTIVEGEQFYDCDVQNDLERSDSLPLKNVRNFECDKIQKSENHASEKTVKKNAFYSSKYLILDPKEENIPKYLETRPCIFSTGKQLRRESSTRLETLSAGDLLEKWLTDHSDDAEEVRRKSRGQVPVENHKIEKKKEEEEEIWQNEPKLLKGNRSNVSSETVNSVASGNSRAAKTEENLNVEGNPETPNANNDSTRPLENSDVPVLHSRPGESAVKTSNGTNFNEETLNLRVAEQAVKMVEKEQSDSQDVEDDQRDSEQSEDSAKDGGTKDPILNNPPRSEGFQSESNAGGTIPPRKETLISAKDLPIRVEGGVTLKDDAENWQERPETEKPLESSDSFGEIKNLDSERQQDVKGQQSPEKNETPKDSDGNDGYVTYSQVLAFRSEREESERENGGGEGGDFSLASAIFSTIGAAINYGGDFFRSKNEGAQSNYVTGRSASEFF